MLVFVTAAGCGSSTEELVCRNCYSIVFYEGPLKILFALQTLELMSFPIKYTSQVHFLLSVLSAIPQRDQVRASRDKT